MKAFLSLLLSIISMPIFCQSPIYVYGEVTQNGESVENHPIYITDSQDSSIYEVAYTNVNGFYMDTVMVNASQGNITISTWSSCTQENLTETRTYFPGSNEFNVDFTCEDSASCSGDFTYTDNGDGVFIFAANVPEDGTTSWYIENGTQGYGSPFTYNFEKSGSYSVCMLFEDSLSGCFFESCDNINVIVDSTENNCSASFWMSDSSATVGDSILFEFNQNSPTTSYMFDFGDGSVSQSRFSSHVYNQPGTYTVCAYIYTQTCADTVCETIYIDSVANMCSGNMDYIDYGDGQFVFWANGTSSQTGSYEWINNGVTIGYGSQFSYEFQNEGTYSICMLYTDSIAECYYEDCNTLTVIFDSTATECSADFWMSDSTITLDDTLIVEVFENDSNYSYFIDAGANQFTYERVGYFSYSQPGTYTVCATVWTQTCADTICKTITVIDNSSDFGFSGIVYQDSNLPLDKGIVYMYDETSLLDSLTITEVDSGYYSFSVNSSGNYKVYAQPIGAANEDDLIPVYHYQSIFWESADLIELTESTPFSSGNDVQLYNIPGAGGIGKIIGTIFRKKTDEMPNVTVLLFKDNLSTPVASTTSDENGQYQFDNLAMGDYIVSIEIFNHKDELLYINLNSSQPESEGNVHIVGNGAVILSVDRAVNLETKVYPNPVRDHIEIINLPSGTNYSVLNVTGKVILAGTFSRGNVIDLKRLKTGLYTLVLEKEGIKNIHRIVKQ
jgi:PKD repeat protein